MKITRRGFISMLALLGTGSVLLPNRKFFLPPWPQTMDGDFATANLRFKCYERYLAAWAPPPTWREPDPALFRLTEQLKSDADRITSVDDRRYAQTRTYEADLEGICLRMTSRPWKLLDYG